MDMILPEKNSCLRLLSIRLALVLLPAIPATAIPAGSEGDSGISPLPAILVERVTDSSSTLVPALKTQYGFCVMKKQSARKAFLEKGYVWDAMKASLKPEYIAHIEAKPHPEPQWEKTDVGKTRVEEYFFKDMYKRIRYGKQWRISKNDGLCRLESYDEFEKQEIDDGTVRYKVTLRHKTRVTAQPGTKVPKHQEFRYRKIVQSRSPVLARQEADAQLKELDSRQLRALKALMDKGLSVPRAHAPGVSEHFTQEDAKQIGKAFGLKEQPGSRGRVIPSGKDENYVLDQLCDIVESTSTGGRIWYWKKMHYYPSVMKRPIVLKSEQKIGQKLVTEEAVRFEVRERFDENLFKPPPRIEIIRR